MRVLFAVNNWPSRDSHYRHSRSLLNEMSKVAEMQVVAASMPKDNFRLNVERECFSRQTQCFDDGGIEVCLLGLGWRSRMRTLARLALNYRHGNSWRLFKGMYDELMPQIRKLVRNADVVLARDVYNFHVPRLAFDAARAENKPYLLMPLMNDSSYFTRPSIVEWLRSSKGLLAICKAEKKMLCDLGVDPPRVFVCPFPPCAPEGAGKGKEFRRKYSIPPDSFLVLYLGRKELRKGLRLVIQSAPDVWKTYPNTYFAFVGPHTKQSVDLITQVSDSRIIDVPPLTGQALLDVVSSCDVFCLPSFHFHGPTNAHLLAWKLGKPIIAGNRPATREMATNGRNSILVNPTPRDVATAILRLLEDPLEARRMAGMGKREIRKLTWNKMASQVIRAIHTVLSQD